MSTIAIIEKYIDQKDARIKELEEENKSWQRLHNTNNLIPIDVHRRIVEELKRENINVQSYNESIIAEFNKQKQQLKEANEVIDVYADPDNDYFVDKPKTKFVNNVRVYTMKTIVQMAKLAQEYQTKYNGGE